MGRKITLAASRASRAVRLLVDCMGEGCCHRAEMDLEAMISRVGGDVRMDDVRFRCSACGSRRVDVRPGWPPTGPGGLPL
jgi:hypothetical protein